MNKHAVAVPDAVKRQPPGGGPDTGGETVPGPDRLASDQARPLREAPRGLQQERREIGGGDQLSGSRIET